MRNQSQKVASGNSIRFSNHPAGRGRGVALTCGGGWTIGTGGIGPVTGRIVSAYHDLVRSQGTPIQPAAPACDVVAGSRV